MDIADVQDCPVCNSDCLGVTRTIDSETYEEKGNKVCCFNCGAMGPLGESVESAMVLWHEMKSPTHYLADMIREGDLN